MIPIEVDVEYRLENDAGRIKSKASKLIFSPFKCFLYDNSPEEVALFGQIAGYIKDECEGGLALYGNPSIMDYLFKHYPQIKTEVECVIDDNLTPYEGFSVVAPGNLPESVKTVFICETRHHAVNRLERKINKNVKTVSPYILEDLDWRKIPSRGWIEGAESIYPFELPDFEVREGLDLLLMDVPSRNLSLMPNGLGYVRKSLEGLNLNVQTIDGDIIIYHRFHTHRLLDCGGMVEMKEGKDFPEDPWMNEHMPIWQDPDTLAFFEEDLEQIVNAIKKAKPKILGLSIQDCNLMFSKELAKRIRKEAPETIILVGGYSCRQVDVGLKVFPDCDYMAIGEVDLTLGDMVTRLAKGERPVDVPGYLSRNNSTGWVFKDGDAPEDLDKVGEPIYDWYGMEVYRNFNHYQLTPVIASRGCRWGRCNFCGEVLAWRKRTPSNFVDELEKMVDLGSYQFVFSESDMNGDPKHLMDICDEIIRRRMPIVLAGQLRINRHSTPEFFSKLRAAGCASMRFGVDGWSDRMLKVQNKGYNTKLIRQNIKDCSDSGMFIEVNAVIGCPGETDDDVQDYINLMLELKKYIGSLANINALQLLRDSLYWKDPGKFNIHFREDRIKIYNNHYSGIPDTLWYSTEPYIDHEIRRQRCDRILTALKNEDYGFGAGASPKVEQMESDQEVDILQEQRDRFEVKTAEPTGETAEVSAQEKTAVAVAEPEPEAEAGVTDYDVAGYGFKYKGNYFIFNDGIRTLKNSGEVVTGSQHMMPGKRTLIQKVIHGLAHPDRWGDYSRRIYYGSLALMRSKGYRQAGNGDGTETGNDPSLPGNDFGKFDILQLDQHVRPEFTTMVKESFNGYNLIRARSKFYAIKHGFPFDLPKMERGELPQGVLIEGNTLKELVNAIDSNS